jgi:hypothetical protein
MIAVCLRKAHGVCQKSLTRRCMLFCGLLCLLRKAIKFFLGPAMDLSLHHNSHLFYPKNQRTSIFGVGQSLPNFIENTKSTPGHGHDSGVLLKDYLLSPKRLCWHLCCRVDCSCCFPLLQIIPVAQYEPFSTSQLLITLSKTPIPGVYVEEGTVLCFFENSKIRTAVWNEFFAF